jgi:hypothetical protein
MHEPAISSEPITTGVVLLLGDAGIPLSAHPVRDAASLILSLPHATTLEYRHRFEPFGDMGEAAERWHELIVMIGSTRSVNRNY